MPPSRLEHHDRTSQGEEITLCHYFIMRLFLSFEIFCLILQRINNETIMATSATNKLWAYIESLSLSKRDRNWLAGKLLEPAHDADPYEISPSGDTFFADSRNVKA